MSERRFIVELGMGADLHGQDVTRAAIRAVRNAIAHNCLCGLSEICNINDPEQMRVHVIIACPKPGEVDEAAVLDELPLGRKTIEVKQGGMISPGLYLPQLGDASEDVIVANASVIVSVDISS
jgi:uncharacterized protein (TIGR02058 family)